jgi:hypothetical protein
MKALAPSAALTLLATIFVAGCSGGSKSPPASGPTPTAPTLTAIADQTVAQDSTSTAIGFTLADPDSDLATVTLSVKSSNVDLIDADGIVLGGNGGSRSLTLTPNERLSGSSMITVTATDPQGSTASQSFMLQVTTMLVSFKDFTSQALATGENGMPQSIKGVSFNQDADDPASFDAVLN